MASAPIKFRCFRCNQLLGVSRTKAGAVVACPKCQIELVVPQPEDAPARVPNPGPSGSNDGGISLDVLNIRPEDIRVEGGWQPTTPTPPTPPPAPTPPSPPPASQPSASSIVEPPPGPASVDEMMPVGEVAWPVAEAPRAFRPAPAPTFAPAPTQPSPTSVADSFPRRHAVVPQHLEEPPLLPAIQLETTSVSTRSRLAEPSIRSRDLILPRSVVASWSLLVLFGLAFAFIAGLLAGHYVWRVH